MSAPDELDLFALSDLATPWCLHVVATLRVADQIAAGVTQIDDLADRMPGRRQYAPARARASRR